MRRPTLQLLNRRGQQHLAACRELRASHCTSFALDQFPQLDRQAPLAADGQRYQFILAEQCGAVVPFIATQLQANEALARELIAFGAVYHKPIDTPAAMKPRRLVQIHTQLQEGDILRVHTHPRRFPNAVMSGEYWRSRIIADEAEYIVLNKPRGVPVHASVDNLFENALEQLTRATAAERLWPPHRLDVDTHGLMVLSKSKQFATDFHQLGKVRKLYKATVACNQHPFDYLITQPSASLYFPDSSTEEHTPPSIQLVHWQQPGKRAPRLFTTEPEADHESAGKWDAQWKECKLRIHECGSVGGNAWELSLELLTGRTHQIRGQLGQVGLPVLGDAVYSNPRDVGGMKASPQLQLQASSLSFQMPGLGGEMKHYRI